MSEKREKKGFFATLKSRGSSKDKDIKRNATNSTKEHSATTTEGQYHQNEESQYVDLRSISNKGGKDMVYKGSNMNLIDTANGRNELVDDNPDESAKPRKPLERRESSRLQNAAKKLRRSLSSKVVSHKHHHSSSAHDDYVDIRTLDKEIIKNKTKEENKLNSELEKNGDDVKGRRRSSASAFFSSPHVSHTSEMFKRPDKLDTNVKGTNKTKEKRSHSFNGRSDSKKAAKLASLVRRESSSNVEKRQMLINSPKQNKLDPNVSVNPNGGSSKSCEDLLDPSSKNIYSEIPATSVASSLSGAVRTPYCTISELFQKPEETIPGAKSILLTEDNLVRNMGASDGESEYVSKGSPDLIQNLPHSNSARQISAYVSKSYSVLRAEDNYSDYDYIDEFRSSNIPSAAEATGFGNNLINHNSTSKDHEEYYSSIISLTTRRRHHPQSSGHSSSSVDIWKRHSQFGPDSKQSQLPASSSKGMGRSQSTDSINDLAESLLMEVGGNHAMEEEHQMHPSRDYFAPIPQLSHQSGNSLYSVTNGRMLNQTPLSNGDTKSMVIMPNLQPTRYQMQQQQLPHPSPLINHQQPAHREHQQPQYQQFNNNQQQTSTPFYYHKQQHYQQPSPAFTPANGAQSLPYMSRSISVDSYSPASPSVLSNTNANKESSVPPFTKKLPRNCELEEYARRYEALQRQSSARRRSSRDQKKKQLQQQQMENNQGPKSLQHHLPLNVANSYPNTNKNNNITQLNPNKTNNVETESETLAKTHLRSTLLRKYSNELWNVGGQSGASLNGEGLPYRESGRESVSTILSNSSSETVRYQDSVITQNGGNQESLYHSLHSFIEEQKENTWEKQKEANEVTTNGYTSTRGSKQPMSISEFAFNDTSNPMPPASLSWQKEKEKTLICDNNNESTSKKDNIDDTDSGSDALYASLNFGNVDKQGLQNQQYASISYLQANIPPKDLKRFPLQTYANGKNNNETAYDESGYSMLPFSNNNNATNGTRTTLKQRKQASKGYIPGNNEDTLQHSKSVPNLSTEKQNDAIQNQDENTSPVENSFSYLDPEKRLRVSDNTLKLIQKQALRDYYERHNTLNKKSSKTSSKRKNSSAENECNNQKTSVVSSLQNPAETSNSSSTDLDSGFYSPTDNSKHQTLDTSNNNEVKSSNASSPSTDVKSIKMAACSFDIKRNYSHRSASQSSTRSSLSSTSTATTVHRKSSVDTVINANTTSMNSDTAIYCNGSVSSSFSDTKASFSKVATNVEASNENNNYLENGDAADDEDIEILRANSEGPETTNIISESLNEPTMNGDNLEDTISVTDLLDDEEIENILDDNCDQNDDGILSARPVYLQEAYGGSIQQQDNKHNQRKKYSHPIVRTESLERRSSSSNASRQQDLSWSNKNSNNNRPSSMIFSSSQQNGHTGDVQEKPPERPPKKPHLRQATSSRENTPPPETPPRGHTPSMPPSRPPSRSSPPVKMSNCGVSTPSPQSEQSSRGTTPVSCQGSQLLRSSSSSSSIRCRPKFPSPPGSPNKKPSNQGSRRAAVSPDQHSKQGGHMPSIRRPCDELPLPPPPQLDESQNDDREKLNDGNCNKPTLRIRDKELSIDGQEPHLGHEGKYRRTSSPSVCNTPNVKPSVAALNSNKSAAKTPKRDSPATIAAKGAPGWDRFLGGNVSTITFTSEEAQKFKQQKEEGQRNKQQNIKNLINNQKQRLSQQQAAPKPPPKPRTSANGLLETSFDGDRLMVPPDPSLGHPPTLSDSSNDPTTSPNQSIALSNIHTSKSQPSLHSLNANVSSSPFTGPHYAQELNGNSKTPQEQSNGNENLILNNHVHKKSNSSPTSAMPQNNGSSSNNNNNNSNRWKNSLDSLNTQQQVNGNLINESNMHHSPGRGFTIVNNNNNHIHNNSGDFVNGGPTTNGHHHQNHHLSPNTVGAASHSHSNSDSGLSSLSGRTSTMSPISTMSTVSSVSSASSSGSSSRASLRSASIVSSCTIPLDEEDEDEISCRSSMTISPSGTIQTRIGNNMSSGNNSRHSRHMKELSRDSGNGGSLKRGGNKGGSNHQSNLRVNGGNNSNFPSKPISIGRTKFQEEVECEKLSKELLDYLPTSDSIKRHASLFVVPPEGKATADYMEGLFDLDLDDVQLHSSSATTKTNISPFMLKKRIEVLQHDGKRMINGVATSTTNQEYNEDTETKPKLFGEANSKNANILLKKREGLTSLISKKLEVLRAEQVLLKGEKKLNEELGRQVTVKVMQSAAPNECEKYKLLVEETDKITSLLLGLSGRLVRTENSLQVAIMLSPQGETQEKEQLFVKRDKLAEQLTEAKKLKQNIDKRSSTVTRMLQKYLSEEQLSSYQTFIKTKTKLIIESRIINDKITLSEEQFNALKE